MYTSSKTLNLSLDRTILSAPAPLPVVIVTFFDLSETLSFVFVPFETRLPYSSRYCAAWLAATSARNVTCTHLA